MSIIMYAAGNLAIHSFNDSSHSVASILEIRLHRSLILQQSANRMQSHGASDLSPSRVLYLTCVPSNVEVDEDGLDVPGRQI